MLKIFLTVIIIISAHAVSAFAGDREQDTLERARRLLDIDRAVKVVLIDPDLAPDPEALRRLDAFVVREPGGAFRPAIYINRHSQVLRRAAAGSDFHLRILAGIIHHEAAHLGGASEAEARRAEAAFFRSMMTRGDVPPAAGLRYLRLLGVGNEDH